MICNEERIIEAYWLHMRVGIDYRPVLRPNSRRRGIGKFTASQIEHLLRGGDHEIVLYTISSERPELPGRPEWRELPQIHRPNRLNWLLDRFRLHNWVEADRLDLYHATEVTAVPSRSPFPLVVTVHDVIPLVYWDHMKSRLPLDYRIGLKHAYNRATKADQIITISTSARDDICSHLGVEEEKIEVIYPGCNPLFRPVGRDAARRVVESKSGLQGPFLFYVGGSDFRKNLDLLVRGYAGLREKGYRGSLVLAGETFLMKIPEIRGLRHRIRNLNLEEWVVFPGYLEDSDLPAFYSACDLFIFPSLYEGFGLPVLEAMACGAPVVASDRSSMPEVGGEMIEYFDPETVESLVENGWRLLGDSSRLDQMRLEGPDRAARFSWSENATSLSAVYESLK